MQHPDTSQPQNDLAPGDSAVSPLAVASLTSALLGLVAGARLILGTALIPLSGLFLWCLPVAVVLGAVALYQFKRAPAKTRGKGLAIAGLALAGMAALVALMVAFALTYDGR